MNPKQLSQIDVLRLALAQRDVLLPQSFALCREWALAEDAFQEALLVAAERWEDVRDEAGVLPWMRRIVHLKSLELVRREQRHGLTTMDDTVLESVSAALASLDEHHQEARQDHLASLKQALHLCMESLRPDHRRLLDAFYWQRRSCEELADEFKRRPDNLRAILSRLRKRLQRCVEQRGHSMEYGS